MQWEGIRQSRRLDRQGYDTGHCLASVPGYAHGSEVVGAGLGDALPTVSMEGCEMMQHAGVIYWRRRDADARLEGTVVSTGAEAC